MGENRLKVGLGLLTVLATPIAVNSLASNEVHAAEEKQVVVEKQVTAEKAVKADDKVIVEKQKVEKQKVEKQKVEKQKVSEKLVEDKKIEAVEEKTLTEKPASVEKQTIIEKEVETKNSVVPKEGGKPAEEKKEQVKTGYDNGIFYDNGKLANWWYDDGSAWYFFQNGKKHTGEGKDNAGIHYFVNGKYANGTENGIYYVNGKQANGYEKGTFYDNGKLANWWYDDGTAWYFFQNGKKHTGEGKDNAGTHYFADGKYANGYQNGTYYVKGEAANWWYDDGTAWYFFQNGKKHTGEGKDNAGIHYFVNGKYANGTENGIYYVNGKQANGYEKGTFYDNGKLANWWYDDGTAWYFFQNGKKHTGEGKDNAGVHYFVDGKYGTGEYNGKIYIDGKETTPIKYGYKNGLFFADSKLANWWYDDGTAWYFFQNGKKYTGKGKDNAGYHYFVNGKYDNNVPALNMPQYYQNDARWGRKVYGMSNMAAAGCVPTSLAMVFSGLGKPVLPTAVADTISNGGGLNYGGFGTSAKGAADAIKKYGYNYRVLKTKEQLVNALRNGESVLATVQQGYFVRSAYETHAVVLSGFDNGKVRALDPYNKNATGKWYNINEIWNQRSTAASDTMLGGSFTAIEK